MSVGETNRTLPWDWYKGTIPENVLLDEAAHLETTYSFRHFRSLAREAVRIGHGATVYLGTMFDLGPEARVSIGQYTLINGAWITCDSAVEIGDYCLLSWNVVLMDTYRAPLEPAARRLELRDLPHRERRRLAARCPARPIRIGRNVWIGFDSCVLPGVSVGEGSIIGARSVVFEDVAPFTVVAGNPARVIRKLENDEVPQTA